MFYWTQLARGPLSVVHVTASLPCNGGGDPLVAGNNSPDVSVVAGVAPATLSPVIDQTITGGAQDTGLIGPEKTCTFSATILAGAEPGEVITDIVLINTDSSNDASLKKCTTISTTATYVP